MRYTRPVSPAMFDYLIVLHSFKLTASFCDAHFQILVKNEFFFRTFIKKYDFVILLTETNEMLTSHFEIIT